jgi:hypothetical protein
MMELFVITFVLPSLLVYILIKPLRGEPYIGKCHDEVFVMTLIYPAGLAYILIRWLVKLGFVGRGRNGRPARVKTIGLPKFIKI